MADCNFCCKPSAHSYLTTESQVKFNDKLLSAAEALTIFNAAVIKKVMQQTVARICVACLQQLENCYAFVQQIFLAQQALPNLEQRFILPQANETAQRHTKQKPKRSYKCLQCTEVFNSYRTLQTHALNDHGSLSPNIGNTCEYCCTIFANEHCLEQHIAEQHVDRKHLCKLCGKVYQIKGHLLQHMRNVHQHNVLPYYCSLCVGKHAMHETYSKALSHFAEEHKDQVTVADKSDTSTAAVLSELDFEVEFLDEAFLKDFGNLEDLENLDFHIPDMLQLNYESLELYRCPRCQEQVKTPNLLLVHLAHAHKLHVLSCNNCDSKFNQLSELMKHRREHVARGINKEFVCNKCQKEFKSLGAWQYHLKTHQNKENVLQCPWCEKSFNTGLNLKQHMRSMHTQIKSHICQLCDRQFATHDHLKKHVLSLHQNDRKYICHICAKAFTQSCHLKQHLQIHAGGKQIACASCDKKFWRKIDMRRHAEREHAMQVDTSNLDTNLAA